QRGDDSGKDDAEPDCNPCTQNHSPDALPVWQSTAGHCNNNRVVAGQQDVDPHDLGEGDPELGVPDVAPTAADHRPPTSWIYYLKHRTHLRFLPLRLVQPVPRQAA